MTATFQPTIARLARWSSRLALFSASVVLTGAALHRLGSFPTPATLNLLMLGLAGAGLAVLAGVVALAQIWRRGHAGAWTAAGGLMVGLTLLAWPLAYLPAALSLPAINDITTDWTDPPRFVALAKGRGEGANNPVYPGEQFALAQQQAYPDLHSFMIDRPVNEVFELVVDAVRGRHGLGWKVASANFHVSRISLCMRASREPFPLSPLAALTTMAPSAFPLCGSKCSEPLFRANLPCTVCIVASNM